MIKKEAHSRNKMKQLPEEGGWRFFDNQINSPIQYLMAGTNEWYIYGSEGHGRFARAYPYVADERQGYSNELFVSELTEEKRYLKQKQYELKDHLGNVRVVLSDMKIPVNANDTLPPFRADVLAAYSHYPFGMLQPGMFYENVSSYRFGFNGMMRDDDVKDLALTSPLPNEGVGNSYATQFRLYDPRVTRWFSLDPLKAKFPWTSPYVGMGNNPVSLADRNGMEPLPREEGINLHNAVLPPQGQQILGGLLGIAGGTAAILLSGGTLTAPSVAAMSTGALLLESAMFTSSIFTTAASSVQTISAVVGNLEAAEAASKNPGQIFGMAVDGLTGNKDNTYSNSIGSLFALYSIGSTFKSPGSATLKSTSIFSTVFSTATMLKDSGDKDTSKEKSKSGDTQDKSIKFAPTQSIKMGLMGK